MFVSSGSAFIVLLTSNDPGFSTFLRGAEIPHAAYYHKIHRVLRVANVDFILDSFVRIPFNKSLP